MDPYEIRVPEVCTKTNATSKLLEFNSIGPGRGHHLLSISTRGIGLMLSQAVEHANAQYYVDSSDESDDAVEVKIPLAEMYRVSLAQLEAKVHFSTHYVSRSNISSLFEEKSSLTHDMAHRIKWSMCPNLSQVSFVINSVGHVTVNNDYYEPIFMRRLSPLNIRITNLREYCMRMSNLETPVQERMDGHRLNSIPNAKWEYENREDSQSVYLANPDDIIPDGYLESNSLLDSDIFVMRSFIWRVNHNSSLHNLEGTIDYDGEGNPGILVSTDAYTQSMRLNHENNVVSNGNRNFWSRQYLDPYSWNTGVITLAGEVPDPYNVPCRSKHFATHESYCHWGQHLWSLLTN